MQMTNEKVLKTYNVILLSIRLNNTICTGQSRTRHFSLTIQVTGNTNP